MRLARMLQTVRTPLSSGTSTPPTSTSTASPSSLPWADLSWRTASPTAVSSFSTRGFHIIVLVLWITIFARFLLRYLSGLFSYQREPKFATRLQVFERKTLEDYSVQPWVVEVNQIEVEHKFLHLIQTTFSVKSCHTWNVFKVTDFGDCNDDSLKLEPGPSSRFTAHKLIAFWTDLLELFRHKTDNFRIAAFNAYNNTFKIIDLVTRTPLLSFDLRQEVLVTPLFTIFWIWTSSGILIFRQALAQCSAAGNFMTETGSEAILSS